MTICYGGLACVHPPLTRTQHTTPLSDEAALCNDDERHIIELSKGATEVSQSLEPPVHV